MFVFFVFSLKGGWTLETLDVDCAACDGVFAAVFLSAKGNQSLFSQGCWGKVFLSV
jgi:hypothetical protein